MAAISISRVSKRLIYDRSEDGTAEKSTHFDVSNIKFEFIIIENNLPKNGVLIKLCRFLVFKLPYIDELAIGKVQSNQRLSIQVFGPIQ